MLYTGYCIPDAKCDHCGRYADLAMVKVIQEPANHA